MAARILSNSITLQVQKEKKNSKGRILFSIFAIDGWQDPGINDSFKKKSLFTNKTKKIGE